MDGRPHSEDARKLVHIGFGACAFLLRTLDWRQAALLAAIALAFNVLVMPRVGRGIYRPADRLRKYAHGIVFYPLAVLLLVLAFPFRLDIAAAAWAILAFGDGAASLVGARAGGPRIPWNPDKSIAGSSAMFVFGSVGGVMLAWWCSPGAQPPPAHWYVIVAPIAAALVAALVETVPVRLDDNLSVPAAAAAVLWALSLVRVDLVPAALAAASASIVPAVAVNGAIAWIGFRARTVTTAGAVAGALIGIAIVVSAGWGAWALLVATFLTAAATSRMGLRRKKILGIEEERGGRRGPGNAIANTGLAAAAALISAVSEARAVALLAFTAALAAGGSDTIASEIGKAWGKRTFLVTSLRPVRPGTSGAISLEGTIAGLAGASLLAAIGVAAGLIQPTWLAPVVIGATIGAVAESFLGATLEDPGIVNNDLLNFFTTAIAAAAAVLLARAWT
ncbi:MAG TPA: DUF92 domain-containing protein [Vicinamibacterales bacterium]|nr:DUF92 domain-containing protein [Vicinamibacterales bacterium]